ncbi:MAG: Ser-Thr-rich GPI-anchored membrane family protein [Candidatus Hodarchaeota archaeon]
MKQDHIILFILLLTTIIANVLFVNAIVTPGKHARESITVINPISDSKWRIDWSYTIKWTYTGNFDYVQIELYKGSSFAFDITSSTANAGEYPWVVPREVDAGSDYRIKITSTSDSSVYGYSDYFEIIRLSITVTSPTSESKWTRGSSYNITWNYTGDFTSVRIDLYIGFLRIKTIVNDTNNTGSYSWTVPHNLTSGKDYRIRISWIYCVCGASIYDYSEYFEIRSLETITITSPMNNTVWTIGSAYTIECNYTGNIETVQIELYKGEKHNLTIALNATNNGSYPWVPQTGLIPSTDYRIKIISTNDSLVYDYSEYFEIESSLTSTPTSSISTPTSSLTSTQNSSSTTEASTSTTSLSSTNSTKPSSGFEFLLVVSGIMVCFIVLLRHRQRN